MKAQGIIESFIARIVAAMQQPGADNSILLRHVKGLRTHLIGFLDELEKRLEQPRSNK